MFEQNAVHISVIHPQIWVLENSAVKLNATKASPSVSQSSLSQIDSEGDYRDECEAEVEYNRAPNKSNFHKRLTIQ